MKTLLIVGTSFHTLRDYILDHGMEYVSLKDVRLTKHPEKRLKRRVVCDFSSHDSIMTALDELNKRFGAVDGVIATYENYIAHAAFIAEKLGLPGMPQNSAKACTDKQTMRELFAHSIRPISPDFAIASSEETIIEFTQSHNFPLILKPANLSKSLLVTKSHTLEELIQNYREANMRIKEVYGKYAPTSEPKLIIEEFMEGPIHSVDAFVDSNGIPHVLDVVVDYQTGYDIGYDDNFHYSRVLPSALDQNEVEQIRETAYLGCQALGMHSSPAHVEIIRTAQGPRIVEIGARNGGYRERMHALANGIDITGNAIALALDEPLYLKPAKSDSCAVLELFPKKPGIFTSISNVDQLRGLASYNYFALKQKLGSHVGKSSEGFKMCAIIILHNSDAMQLQNDLAFIREEVSVQVD